MTTGPLLYRIERLNTCAKLWIVVDGFTPSPPLTPPYQCFSGFLDSMRDEVWFQGMDQIC